ncbi:hypothetical protein [Nannocystis bainbridge]|uniref:Uncharacterized protein n=1 Tax=Nannocystis bainbridge TaxID=2995303 RepID=A0ABT5E6X7_9BACT|nr:hypothetical protein [Nannocystis bainbridge]MDC0721613.1 hypothetical protein [Nannocystis bainbridge]
MSLAAGLFGQVQAPTDGSVAVPPAPAAPADPAAAPAPAEAPAPEAPPEAPAPAVEAAPTPAPVYVQQDTSYPPPPPTPKKPRFVFAFLPGPTFGLSHLPSVNLPFFFGGRLKHSNWALGFQFTLSAGLAERYFSGLLTHRYHLMGLTQFGARGRGFASVGGGFAVRMFSPMVEVEGRVGFRFGRRGVVGGMVRLGYDFAHREGAPVPQVGAFIGVCNF